MLLKIPKLKKKTSPPRNLAIVQMENETSAQKLRSALRAKERLRECAMACPPELDGDALLVRNRALKALNKSLSAKNEQLSNLSRKQVLLPEPDL